MSDNDVLGQVEDVKKVADWYWRLAVATEARGSLGLGGYTPLAAQFLKQYLSPNESKGVKIFPAPSYLANYIKVKDVLAYHRSVFLSQEKARVGSTEVIAGVLPRLESGEWSGQGQLSMNYESLVEVGANIIDVYRIQRNGTPQEQDLFTSLRGFQLRSDVILTGVRTGNQIKINIHSWMAKALDVYDFNYDEYLTIFNPDYQSTNDDAIRPDLAQIRVQHSNAKRMEDSGLAAPFSLQVGPWSVTDTELLAEHVITL